MTPNFWCLHPYVILSVGRKVDLLLINRVMQKWWDVTSSIMFQTVVISILLEECLSGWLWWDKQPFEEVHVGETKESHSQQPARKWGQPLGDRKQENEALRPVGCKRLISANSIWVFESDPSMSSLRWDFHHSWHVDCSLVDPWKRWPS